jgi:hypothetical protein
VTPFNLLLIHTIIVVIVTIILYNIQPHSETEYVEKLEGVGKSPNVSYPKGGPQPACHPSAHTSADVKNTLLDTFISDLSNFMPVESCD